MPTPRYPSRSYKLELGSLKQIETLRRKSWLGTQMEAQIRSLADESPRQRKRSLVELLRLERGKTLKTYNLFCVDCQFEKQTALYVSLLMPKFIANLGGGGGEVPLNPLSVALYKATNDKPSSEEWQRILALSGVELSADAIAKLPPITISYDVPQEEMEDFDDFLAEREWTWG